MIDSTQSRQRESIDQRSIVKALRKRKKEKERPAMSSPTMSDKQTNLDVFHVEDDDGDAPHQKIRKPKFNAPPNKEGSWYTVLVLNNFMLLDRSIWHEADKFLFPCAEDRLQKRHTSGLMFDGLELTFQV